MPHWTLPAPQDNDPTAGPTRAVLALQTELDKLLDRPGGLPKSQLDALEAAVKTFYKDFEAHVHGLRHAAPKA